MTVLFADVVASTQLSEAVDPERLRAQMARFFDLAQKEIARYGGTLEKFIGDAVMAVFGLPTIHEDDPERAARAALAIRSAVGAAVETGSLPQIRVGIQTGEVVANPRATEKGEFLVTGETVNLAARLQQAAQPGQILIGERTMFALKTLAHLRALEPIAARGKQDGLPAWELLEIAPPRERPLQPTPFVGREEELDLLASHVRRMRREGRGHVVTILGPAGVGKTRLVREFRIRTEAAVRVLQGRAIPYGTGVPFWALGEAIRDECGIMLGDPLETARRKVQEAGARLEIVDTTPALLTVLGLQQERVDLMREVLFSSMRAFFQAVAQEAPLLLILEDVHSAEDVTLDFLEHTADWIRDVPLFLLVLARPELLERRSGWMGGKRGATTLFLDPLGGNESRALARAILKGKPAPEPLVEVLLNRAEGNPLFVEEMLRALMERYVLTEQDDRWVLTVSMDQLTLPDSIHAVIAARVDALPSAEKQALQTAAIVGKDFWLGAVHYVADENHIDEAIRALIGKDVLVHKRRSTLLGEEEFAFRHILIRDVAYAMLSKMQRWPKHARCAQWLYQIAGDRQAEYADIVAHHWLQVVALRQELGLPPDHKAREQAISNLLLAGDRAAGLYANTTTLDHYTRALELAPEASDHLSTLTNRGKVWMLLGQYERAREDFVSVRTLARETGQPQWECIALDQLGVSFRRQDRNAQALQHLEPALALSRDVGDASLTGRILNHIGFTYFNLTNHKEAIDSHEEARKLLEHCGDHAGLAESLHGLGENVFMLGRFPECIRWCSESIAICERVGDRALASENRYMIAFSHHVLGENEKAQAEVQRSVATLAEIGDIWNSSFALNVASVIATTLGQFGKALEYATRGRDLARQIGAGRAEVTNLLRLSSLLREIEDHHGAWQSDSEAIELARTGDPGTQWMPLVLSSLALDSAALGRPEQALTYVQEAHRVLAAGQVRIDQPQGLTYAEGQVRLALNQPREAFHAARTLVEMTRGTGLLYWRVLALLLSADASAALSDLTAAASSYEAAAQEAERLGRTPVLWRALAGLAEILRALGRPDEATTKAQRSREIVDHLAATVPDERLRATFLQSSKVQRVMLLAGT